MLIEGNNSRASASRIIQNPKKCKKCKNACQPDCQPDCTEAAVTGEVFEAED
jgi:hypothetical protein